MLRSRSLRLMVLALAGCALLPACTRIGRRHSLAAQPPVAEAPKGRYTAEAGPYPVETALYDWTDAARDRQVPVKIYYPATGEGPFPVIIFSHGLGGSREGYEYLGRHWASHGYVSVHVQHIGSDTGVWQGAERPMEAMRRAALDPRNALNRPKDVSFAIDQMQRMNREETPLKGRLDLERIGVGGHSFGAYTALAVAGQAPALARAGAGLSQADPRVKAAIAMSAPVTPQQKARLDKVYGPIRIPCLHMTGTKDDSPISDTTAADRRLPFDHITGADQYLVIFNGGDHMVFSGRPRAMPGGENDALFRSLICACTTAFWDAYLKGDEQAKAWLTDGGINALLGANATFEKKVVGG
jgi:predicted dienelactone hydrolase